MRIYSQLCFIYLFPEAGSHSNDFAVPRVAPCRDVDVRWCTHCTGTAGQGGTRVPTCRDVDRTTRAPATGATAGRERPAPPVTVMRAARYYGCANRGLWRLIILTVIFCCDYIESRLVHGLPNDTIFLKHSTTSARGGRWHPPATVLEIRIIRRTARIALSVFLCRTVHVGASNGWHGINVVRLVKMSAKRLQRSA